MQLISYGLPGDAPELLLQTLGWDGRTAASVGDHWQRLRRKAGTAPAPAPAAFNSAAAFGVSNRQIQRQKKAGMPMTEYVQPLTCGSSEDSPELLLQTLGWQDDGKRAAAGDHWQRLRTKLDVEQHVVRISRRFRNHHWV